MLQTHVLEVRMPLRTEYLDFDSEELARGTAFDALQCGMIKIADNEQEVPKGTTFRVLTRHSFTVEKMMDRG